MLKSPKIANLPEEQKKSFLASRLTDEEVSEVFKRLKDGSTSKQATEQAVVAQPQVGYVSNSPQTEQRLASTNGHFLMNAINVASLAVVTSVGVTYMLDKFKEKKDETLRQELKERLYTTLQDSNQRLRSLEIKQDTIEQKLVESDAVEELVQKRFEQFESGLAVNEVKNKTLNLKVRAQPNQKGFYTGDNSQPSEIEQMKLEMVKEMRQMREDLKSAVTSSQECIKELTKLQTQEVKASPIAASSVGVGGVKDDKPFFKSASVVDQNQLGSLNSIKEEKEEEEPLVDLTPVQVTEIDSLVTNFLEKFTKDQLEQVINFSTMPLNQILKQPKEQKWRNVDLDSFFLKRVYSMNQDALGPLLVGLGFTKTNEKQFKFQKSEDDKSLGNLRVLQQAQTFFNQKQAELRNPSLKPIPPQVPNFAKNESSI